PAAHLRQTRRPRPRRRRRRGLPPRPPHPLTPPPRETGPLTGTDDRSRPPPPSHRGHVTLACGASRRGHVTLARARTAPAARGDRGRAPTGPEPCTRRRGGRRPDARRTVIGCGGRRADGPAGLRGAVGDRVGRYSPIWWADKR